MIGVLALQGAFEAHARALARLGHEVRLVRRPADLVGLAGLVLPGGESTTHLNLIARFGLREPLERLVREGVPVLATCAGAILAARGVRSPAQEGFGWLDVDVVRNGWGRQVDSFEALADAQDLPLVFIRAPRIERVGPGVEVLARYRGEPVLVRERNVTAATFHPELTDRLDVHRLAFAGAATLAV